MCDVCNEYESKFGVKIVVDLMLISGGYVKLMVVINVGVFYDIVMVGYIVYIL